ncbi:MAG TPA: MMPL family transporter [Gaiellaceae bacterium]|nr:MMPL family transporter [Gaiellaceae bacterium]
MDRLSRFVGRRRRLVLVVWLAAVVASVPFAARQTEHLTAGGFEVPGSGSLAVANALDQFPGVRGQSLILVFDNPKHNKHVLWKSIDQAVTKIQDVKNVSVPGLSLAFAGGSGNKTVVALPLEVNGKADVAVDAAVDLREKLGIKPDSMVTRLLQKTGLKDKRKNDIPLSVHVVGQQALWAAMQDVSKDDLEKAESTGFPIVLIVLLAIFGSLAAAALPLSLGIVAVIVSGAVVFFLSQVLQMSVFVTNIASMLGIGVAVDYSLFVLARYREEIRDGASPDQARERAMSTSGLAVVVSGVTVIVSLAGLFVIDSTMMRSMAVGAIIVVAIAILGAVTLLPALIHVFGRRIYERGRVIGAIGDRLRGIFGRRERPAGAPDFWHRWTAVVMRRPVLFGLGATALLLLIASPALSLKWGTAALAQLPKTNETRKAIDDIADRFGSGSLGPINVVVSLDESRTDRLALQRFRATAGGLPNVKKVAEPVMSRDGRNALIVVTPTTGPEDPKTVDLVEQLREPGGPAAPIQQIGKVEVGGVPAENKDFTTLVSGSLWKLFLFVLLFSYLVLLLMLRSVLLPLKAVIMNVLTVASAYGVLVAVFRYGWADAVLGFTHLGYVNAPTPPLLLAIVFGLSMDYEVFLLSRIRERYFATRDNRKAVAEGLGASAKTISSAALIMVLVFAVFAITGLPQVKEIGVGLSTAILLDATLVRLVLVPATMQLMGDWNWWLPSWLDRILPNLDFESAQPEAGFEVVPGAEQPAG